jgi:hypothetical protein
VCLNGTNKFSLFCALSISLASSRFSNGIKQTEVQAELELQKLGLTKEADIEAHKAALAAKAIEDKG